MDNPTGYFAQGRHARQQDLPIEAVPFVFDAWPAESWRLGWRFEDLAIRVANGTIDEVPLERILVRPFDQGINARLKGVALEDCPYEAATPNGVQWCAGWMASEFPQSSDHALDAYAYTLGPVAKPKLKPLRSRFAWIKWLLIIAVVIGLMWASHIGYI